MRPPSACQPRFYNNADPEARLRPLAAVWRTETHWSAGRSFAHLVDGCSSCRAGDEPVRCGYVAALLDTARPSSREQRWVPVAWYIPQTMLDEPALRGDLLGRVLLVIAERTGRKLHDVRRVSSDSRPLDCPIEPFDVRARMAAFWNAHPEDLVTRDEAEDYPAEHRGLDLDQAGEPAILAFRRPQAEVASSPRLAERFPQYAARLAAKGGA